MIYRFGKYPLYEKEDLDAALLDLAKYVVADKDDENAINTTKYIISAAYGCNIVKMANFLSVQRMFLYEYADSILKYLHYCGVDCQIYYIRTSDITPYTLIKLAENTGIPLNYWDPNTEWTDFSYTDNIARNCMNPSNLFVHATLVMKNVNNPIFLQSVYSIKCTNPTKSITDIDVNKSHTFTFSLLPSYHPIHIIELINTIHKCF